MNEEILYPALLIISGILISVVALIFLNRVSNKIIRLFDLYPESKGIFLQMFFHFYDLSHIIEEPPVDLRDVIQFINR